MIHSFNSNHKLQKPKYHHWLSIKTYPSKAQTSLVTRTFVSRNNALNRISSPRKRACGFIKLPPSTFPQNTKKFVASSAFILSGYIVWRVNSRTRVNYITGTINARSSSFAGTMRGYMYPAGCNTLRRRQEKRPASLWRGRPRPTRI